MSQEEPEWLYHYTTAKGALGIAESNVLWATNIRYLNDATEFLHTLHLAKVARDRRLGELDTHERGYLAHLLDSEFPGVLRHGMPYYVVSLTTEPDLLSQWRAYAPRSGYSIGWSKELLDHAAQQNGYRLCPCTYDPQQQTEEVDDLLGRTIGEFRQQPVDIDFADLPRYPLSRKELDAVQQLNRLQSRFDESLGRIATVCKNPVFEEEGEWRLISSPVPWAVRGIKFREGAIITPYLEFSLEHKETSDEASTPPKRALRITCGPSPDLALSQMSAMQVFTMNGWPEIRTERSLVPYREW